MGWFKSRNDNDSGYPKYDAYDNADRDKHSHRFGGYTRDGRYYEGGRGENMDEDEKRETGRILRKYRDDDDDD